MQDEYYDDTLIGGEAAHTGDLKVEFLIKTKLH